MQKKPPVSSTSPRKGLQDTISALPASGERFKERTETRCENDSFWQTKGTEDTYKRYQTRNIRDDEERIVIEGEFIEKRLDDYHLYQAR